MRIVERITDLNLPGDRKIGFVPTMGAFHEGHLSLMRTAAQHCDFVVASLFVNPLQFGPDEDFHKYPRNLEDDAAMAEQVGVHVLFAPLRSEIYRREPTTTIRVPEISEKWEGEHRPGHFDGVATVVAKLINIVSPQVAYFGRKDFQQCAVIKRMASDLDMRLEICVEPTVRESDGLAMSSRNRYLSESERAKAPKIYKTLCECRDQILVVQDVAQVLAKGRSLLSIDDFDVEYLAYVCDDTLQPLMKIEKNSTIICAAKLGVTRLIDNVSVV